ncbi:MAG: hypothetical protein ACFE89_06410 [Candidatus Hodarchaeota archaeon]
MATAGYAQFEIEGQIKEIVEALEPKFGGCFTRCYEHQGHCTLAILLGQKYYVFWGNNEAAVSIILRDEGYTTFMEVIGFAGGTGLLRLDYGRNKSIIDEVEIHLRNTGFKLTRIHFSELPEQPHRNHKSYTRTEPLTLSN